MNKTRNKFELYGFDGRVKRRYVVTSEKLNVETTTKAEVKPGHSIVIVDRSGSMYGDIASLKDMLIKLFTLDEYNNSSMLVSLISYSTSGDCSLHFDHVPVRDIMKTDSPQQKAIKNIRANGLTCISQAMAMAMELVKDNEPTAIVLHSDGYANDPSTYSEQKKVFSICETFKGKNVFVNTVAYSYSSDFVFLSSIANQSSGKCVKADSVKGVYDVLHDSFDSVNGNMTPPISVATEDANYITFVSVSKKRVNGGSSELTVAGLSSDDDGTVYRYYEVTEDEYDTIPYPEDPHGDYILAFARAKQAEGYLNDAKYAAFSSCITEMRKHLKALTGPQLADMALEIDSYLFKEPNKMWHNSGSVDDNAFMSLNVAEILGTLEQSRDGIMLNFKRLTDGYKLRGVKRIQGTRVGKEIEKPWLEVEFLDAGDWVPMGTFDFNRNNATINMLITRPSRLVKVSDHKPISEVAGINVATLSSFRNYTIVGDGEVVTKEIGIKFGSQKSFDAVKKLGILDVNSVFDQSEHVINLDQFPVTSFNFSADISEMKKAYRDILGDKVVIGILSAITKSTSDKYTSEQLSALDRHYLSGSLNINFPSTTDYDDLETALKNGSVDTRVSYKADVGDLGILCSSELKSANAFLDRHFMAVGAASASDKPTWPLFLDPKVTFQTKPPSSKMKLTEVDSFCKPIFEEFLGLAVNGTVRDVLKRCGINKSVMDIARGGTPMMEEVRKQLEDHMESIYKNKIMPFVFFVGATGLLPDCFNAKGQSAEEFEAQVTGLKLPKAMREGTFFVLDGLVVSVYAKNEYYSTGKDVSPQV